MELGPFFMLLGAMWVTFVPFAAQVKTLNDTRDKIIAVSDSYTTEHRRFFLQNDWIPLFVGACFQQLVLAALLLVLPSVLEFKFKIHGIVLWFCYGFAALALVRFLAFTLTFSRDYRLICRSINSSRALPRRRLSLRNGTR